MKEEKRCDIWYYIEGPADDLKKISNVINILMDNNDDNIADEISSVISLGGDPFGFLLDGFITDCTLEYCQNKSIKGLSIIAKEKDSPSDLRLILQELFAVDITYMLIEPSKKLFQTNDKTGRFFPDRWVLYKENATLYAERKKDLMVYKDKNSVLKKAEIVN